MDIKQFIKDRFKYSLGLENSKFRKNFLNAFPYWVGSLATGIVAVAYAKLFGWAELGTAYIFHHFKWVLFIVSPLTFALSWWITQKYAPYSGGSGIPQVSAAIELSDPKNSKPVYKLLSTKIILFKVASSLIMVFGGGVIGREGPTIQIAASIFKKINDLLPSWYPKISKQNLIITGAAAGLASAFNTPLGGIVFAIEELTKTHFSYFKSALLTGVIIAGLTALHFLGPYLYLGYPDLNDIPLWIIVIVTPVAIVTGFVGSGMGTIILAIFKWKNGLTSNIKKFGYIILCGLVIACFAYFAGNSVVGSGKDVMQTALFTPEKHLQWYFPVLRVLGSIVSFSTGAAGGIFAPSLSAGASIGAVVAGWAHLSPTSTNLIILCGMVGFLTGITRSPFTSSILVIEMTNSHNIIFHLMFTALLANIIANLISKHSFYDHLKDQYIHNIHKDELPATSRLTA